MSQLMRDRNGDKVHTVEIQTGIMIWQHLSITVIEAQILTKLNKMSIMATATVPEILTALVMIEIAAIGIHEFVQ